MTDKPARALEKLTKELREARAEKNLVERALQVATETISTKSAEALDLRLKTNSLVNSLQDNENRLSVSTSEIARLKSRIEEAALNHRQSAKVIKAQNDLLNGEARRNEQLEQQIAELQSRTTSLSELEARQVELTKICDNVRDRMRRRERETEQALLNRKAMPRLITPTPQIVTIHTDMESIGNDKTVAAEDFEDRPTLYRVDEQAEV